MTSLNEVVPEGGKIVETGRRVPVERPADAEGDEGAPVAPWQRDVERRARAASSTRPSQSSSIPLQVSVVHAGASPPLDPSTSGSKRKRPQLAIATIVTSETFARFGEAITAAWHDGSQTAFVCFEAKLPRLTSSLAKP